MSQPGGPDIATLLGLGAATAGLLVVGLALGWLVDRALGSLPVFVLIGLALGVVGASAYVYAQFKKFMRE